VNIPGSFRCDCPVGITGERCETNIDECASQPCLNDGTCLDDLGNFRCVCVTGQLLSVSLLHACLCMGWQRRHAVCNNQRRHV